MGKGSKLKDDPKCPVFLGVEVKKASELWEETNNLALDRLNRLRGALLALLDRRKNVQRLAFRQSFCLGEI